MAIDQLVCPMYDLLHVLHLSLYMPLLFRFRLLLFLLFTFLFVVCCAVVFVVLYAMFKLVCLNMLVF